MHSDRPSNNDEEEAQRTAVEYPPVDEGGGTAVAPVGRAVPSSVHAALFCLLFARPAEGMARRRLLLTATTTTTQGEGKGEEPQGQAGGVREGNFNFQLRRLITD